MTSQQHLYPIGSFGYRTAERFPGFTHQMIDELIELHEDLTNEKIEERVEIKLDDAVNARVNDDLLAVQDELTEGLTEEFQKIVSEYPFDRIVGRVIGNVIEDGGI